MEALERLVDGLGVKPTSRTIDIYTNGTVELYTGPLGDMPRIGDLPRIGELPQIRPSYGINVIPYGNLSGLGGDFHDSFNLDRYGNMYGGHTTIKLPGYDKYKIDW